MPTLSILLRAPTGTFTTTHDRDTAELLIGAGWRFVRMVGTFNGKVM